MSARCLSSLQACQRKPEKKPNTFNDLSIVKAALGSYYYALSGRKTAHTFAESALGSYYYALSGRKTAHTFAESALSAP